MEDNSPDGTLDIAKLLQEIFGKEHLVILSRPAKMGLGSAYIGKVLYNKNAYLFKSETNGYDTWSLIIHHDLCMYSCIYHLLVQ